MSYASLLLLTACTGVTDDAKARYAWLGLAGAVDQAVALGMEGYSEAQSANIDPQSGDGAASGSIEVTGKVDQGSSDNKELRLEVALAGYRDAVEDDTGKEILTVYDTPDAPLDLDLSLRDMPDGTFTGTFAGAVWMSEGLEGELDLDVTLSGTLQASAGDAVELASVAVSGTATSAYGSFRIED